MQNARSKGIYGGDDMRRVGREGVDKVWKDKRRCRKVDKNMDAQANKYYGKFGAY